MQLTLAYTLSRKSEEGNQKRIARHAMKKTNAKKQQPVVKLKQSAFTRHRKLT